MNEGMLQGRVALVTGASRGLGQSMAVALGQAGAKLALVARDAEQLEKTAEQVRAAGSEAEIYPTDVTDEQQVAATERQVAERFGHISILVNNAGTNIRKNITDFTLEEWNQVITTNLTSAFLLCRAFVPHMKGKGYGRIINMASIMGHVSLGQRSAYSSSKAAILGLTKSLAMELAPEKITVVAISPGPFATEMNLPLLNNPEAYQQFVSKIPLGQWGDVQDIGKLAVFLCSDGANYITGTDILIDGGWCAQ